MVNLVVNDCQLLSETYTPIIGKKTMDTSLGHRHDMQSPHIAYAHRERGEREGPTL